MRKLFAFLFVILIVFVGFGFYRGWFVLSRPAPATGTNDVNINLKTDRNKLRNDAQTVKDKAANLTGNDADAPTEPGDQPSAEAQPNQTSQHDGQLQPTVSEPVQPKRH